MKELTAPEEVDWEELLPKLLAYTHSLLRSLTWFRGKMTDSYLKGQKAEDYVMEAVTRYCENPEKFNPKRNDSLEKYLELSIIRRLISNDVKSKEHKTSKALNVEYNEEGDVLQLDELFPAIEATFDQEIDYQAVLAYIEERVKDDDILGNIYLGRCHFGMSRGQIITDFDMSPQVYDNGVRRLNTIMQTAATIFELKAKTK